MLYFAYIMLYIYIVSTRMPHTHPHMVSIQLHEFGYIFFFVFYWDYHIVGLPAKIVVAEEDQPLKNPRFLELVECQ